MSDTNTNITFASRILDNDIFKNKPGWWFKVYMYILLRVNHADSGVLQAGQGHFTRQELFDDCGIKEDGVDPESLKHVIRYLREKKIIDTIKSWTGIIISIVDYKKMIQNYKADSPCDVRLHVPPNIDDKTRASSPTSRPRKKQLADDTLNIGVPAVLKGLELYEKDRTLCNKIEAVMPSWKVAYPGVDIPALIKSLHAWEVSNPNRRKSNRIKFFQNRISSTQDNPHRNREHAAQSSKPIDPNIKKVILAFKIKKGFAKDDIGWDSLNMNRYRDPAASLLEYFSGNYKEAVQCIDQIANDMNYKKLSWGFDTILKWAADYKLKSKGDN